MGASSCFVYSSFIGLFACLIIRDFKVIATLKAFRLVVWFSYWIVSVVLFLSLRSPEVRVYSKSLRLPYAFTGYLVDILCYLKFPQIVVIC